MPRDDSSKSTLRSTLRDLIQLGEIAFIIGFAYVFFIAPVKLARGESSSGVETIAGMFGGVVWMVLVAFAVGMMP